MYEKFYNFTGMPFQLTPDSRFFFGLEGSQPPAIAHLIYGLSQGEGFIIVTGEVGAGKTTLVESGCGRTPTATPIHWQKSTPRRSPARTCSASP